MAAHRIASTYALRLFSTSAMAARRFSAQSPTVARCTALPWTQKSAQTERPLSMPQCRWYASKKKGKNKMHEVEEETSDPDDMTLDLDDTNKHMSRCIEGFTAELRLVRVGRANPAILDRVRVKIEHELVPLSDIATVTVKDAQNLLVLANDPDHKAAIDSSIRDANLGLNPRIEKNAVVVPVPKPTKESREKLVKDIAVIAERTRGHVLGYRHKAMVLLKSDAKECGMSKSEIKDWGRNIQKLTDNHMYRIGDLIKAKTRAIEDT